MEAIILAGGLGTRLKAVVADVPKPMAPVAGQPFLAWQLDYLIREGIERFILSTGHGAQIIEDHFGHSYRGKEVVYAREAQPLGTGGAMRLALTYAKQPRVFVLNGDSLCDVNFAQLRATCQAGGEHAVGMGVKHVPDAGRYGAVLFDAQTRRIQQFGEKSAQGEGWINAGVYDLPRHALDAFPLEQVFSFEKDYLQQRRDIALLAQPVGEFFIDIGIPEDYQSAQTRIPAWVNGRPVP